MCNRQPNGLTNWDCNLENNAFVRNCNNKVGFWPAFSEISAPIKLTGKACEIKKETKITLNKLWNEVKAVDLTAGPFYSNTTIKDFGIMAYWPTTGFACTYNKECSDNLLCLYNRNPANNAFLYNPGSECSANSGCPNGISTCVDYLCKLDKKYVATELTLPWYCPPGTDGLTFDQQNTARNMVNYYRRLVGTGWAKDKSGYAPIAKALSSVVYLCPTIGNATKQIADKCGDPPYTATHGHTLSYHIIRKVNVDPKAAIEEAIKTWAEQSKLVDLRPIGGAVFYQDEVEQQASDFAKMVYGTNSAIGCSVKECQDKTLVICQYNG
ncbi:SCP-like protein, partial [Ancylostoma duodenale]